MRLVKRGRMFECCMEFECSAMAPMTSDVHSSIIVLCTVTSWFSLLLSGLNY